MPVDAPRMRLANRRRRQRPGLPVGLETLQDDVKIETIATVIVAEEYPVLRIGNVVVCPQSVEMVRQIGSGHRQAHGVLRSYLEIPHEARVSGKEARKPG